MNKGLTLRLSKSPMFRDLHVKKIQVAFVPSNNENQQLSGGEYKGARKRWSLKLRGLINLIGNCGKVRFQGLLGGSS